MYVGVDDLQQRIYGLGHLAKSAGARQPSIWLPYRLVREEDRLHHVAHGQHYPGHLPAKPELENLCQVMLTVEGPLEPELNFLRQ